MTQGTVSRIAIPVGDPNGIGPEIALKTVAAYAGRDDVALTLFGPANVLRDTADMLGLGEALGLAGQVKAGEFEHQEVVAEGALFLGEASPELDVGATARGERGGGEGCGERVC